MNTNGQAERVEEALRSIEKMQRKAKPMRKIIQLCAQAAKSPEFTYMTVLCDDGTVWDVCCRNGKEIGEWKQLPLFPQDDAGNP